MALLRAIRQLFLATIVFAIALIPIAYTAILVLIFRAFRAAVGFFLVRVHGKEIKFVEGLDAVHLRRFEDPQTTTGIRLIFHGKYDLQAIRDRVSKLLTEVNEKKQLVTENYQYCLRKCLGFCYWLKVDRVRVEEHVKLYENDPPKNENELNTIYAQLYAEGTKYTDKPPWMYHVIPLADNFPGLKPGSNYVLLACFHHSVTDGVSFVRMLLNYFVDREKQYDQVITSSKKIPKIIQILHFAKQIFFAPLDTCKYFTGMYDTNCLTGPTLSGTKLIAFSPLVSLERIKRIKNLTGTTVNDVLMSCVAAGIRTYCLSKNDDMSKVVLRSLIPISLQKLSDPVHLHNDCTFTIYEFPLREETAMSRLLASKRNMDQAKNDASVTGIYYYAKYCYNTFPVFLYYILAMSCRITTVVSNTPAAQKNVSFNGGEMINGNGIISHSIPNLGVSFSLSTLSGSAEFCTMVDAAIISKQEIVQEIVDNCAFELDQLEKELQHA